jgi:glyoxylase-like metal-dependent hydrolase (beta-lactamase superfamily II)
MHRRRAIGLIVGGASAGIGGLAAARWWKARRNLPQAGPPAPPSPVGEISQLAERLYVVPGGGGNSAIFIADAGVLVVDTKYPERGDELLERIASITQRPVTHLVNTHFHIDHAGGNDAMPAGALLTVHQNTAVRIGKMRRDTGRGPILQPIQTFSDKHTLFQGDDTVDLWNFGAAHTDGDAFVVFRSARVMHAGDVFIDKIAPIINLPSGGDPGAYAGTIAHATAAITGVERVITGHGQVLPWEEFVRYGEFVRLIVDHVRAAMRAGKDWNQARRELTLPPEFDDYNLERLILTFHDIYKGFTPWWHVW